MTYATVGRRSLRDLKAEARLDLAGAEPAVGGGTAALGAKLGDGAAVVVEDEGGNGCGGLILENRCVSEAGRGVSPLISVISMTCS
jgi:hypothetical protein